MRKLILLAVLLCGCAVAVVHPGAANSFDSQSYDALLVAHSVIESSKADLASGKLPVTAKPALNDLISAYDAADTVYLIYHAAAINGTATPDQMSAVTAALTAVNTKTSALSSAKGN